MLIAVDYTRYFSAKIIYNYKENIYHFDPLETKFIRISKEFGGHRKGGQIWNRANMDVTNMGVPLV